MLSTGFVCGETNTFKVVILIRHSVLLYLQIRPHHVDGPPSDWWCSDHLPVFYSTSLRTLLLPEWTDVS